MKKGDAVRLSTLGIHHFTHWRKHNAQTRGTVHGFSRDGENIWVLFDWKKTAISYYKFYWELVGKPLHRQSPYRKKGKPGQIWKVRASGKEFLIIRYTDRTKTKLIIRGVEGGVIRTLLRTRLRDSNRAYVFVRYADIRN